MDLIEDEITEKYGKRCLHCHKTHYYLLNTKGHAFHVVQRNQTKK